MPQAARKTEMPVPMLDFRAAAVPSSLNEEERTVTFIASTGARGLRRTWRGDYYEELEVSETAVRLGRLQNSAPFLNSHGSWDVSNVLGVIVKAWIENALLMVTVRFSKRDEVEPIFQDIKDGVLCHVSVGYRVHEYQITEKLGELEVMRATDWEPMEVSIVPMGFDDGAVARGAEQQEVSQAKITYRAPGPLTEGGANMPTQTEQERVPAADNGAGNETRGVSAEEATRIAQEQAASAAATATTAERKRVSDIRAAVRAVRLDDTLADALINEGVSLDVARARMFDELAKRDETTSVRGIRTGTDHAVVDNVRDGAANALMHRIDPTAALTDQGRGFANMSLLRLCEELLTMQGVNVRALSPHEIATRALSTSDLAHITSNLVNKTLAAGYESAPRTFVGVFRQGTASDFKAINRIRLSGAPSLEEVKEGGEFKYGKVTDEKESYSLATYGKILPFTRQSIINDDMDALGRVPMMFGRSAADLESDIVWAIITANAALQDGVALFHSTHANLAGSAAAINVTSVALARAAMRKQTGMEGRLINIIPRFLIAGADKENEVDQLLSAIFAATTAAVVPTTLRTLQPVIEPRLTGNQWYLAADSNQVDTIEYSYLQGNQGVYIETKQGFDIDGIAIKARHDFAAKAIDFRGLYKNAGA
jgi:hypothetical protein